jgi:hypothetical protein
MTKNNVFSSPFFASLLHFPNAVHEGLIDQKLSNKSSMAHVRENTAMCFARLFREIGMFSNSENPAEFFDVSGLDVEAQV